MRRGQRWTLVAVLVAVLLALPSLVARVPVGHSSVTAAELLAKIKSSAGVPYSGYGEATGGLALPVTDQFNSIADLLGGTSQLRVWWQNPQSWRVDTISATGEQDLHTDATGTWEWDYESNAATKQSGATAPIRLPRADDLLAPTLARRLLSQSEPTEVTRLAEKRIAGHTVAGLRLVPNDPRTTITRVDVWALPSSGLPVRVDVYGASPTATVMSSTLLDLSTSAPAASTIAFSPPDGAKVSVQQRTDVVTALDQLGRVRPPSSVAGLAREGTTGLGSVGVYGRGVTILVALPLTRRLTASFEGQLGTSVGVTTADGATTLSVGPINLMLTAPVNGSSWLLAGTVDSATLAAAGKQLPVPAGFR